MKLSEMKYTYSVSWILFIDSSVLKYLKTLLFIMKLIYNNENTTRIRNNNVFTYRQISIRLTQQIVHALSSSKYINLNCGTISVGPEYHFEWVNIALLSIREL